MPRLTANGQFMSALGQSIHSGAIGDVRFSPNSGRKSEFPQKAVSALALKGDMCSAVGHVAMGQKQTSRRTRLALRDPNGVYRQPLPSAFACSRTWLGN